jgi:transposase-like protein
MTSEKSLRLVNALVEDVLSGGDVNGLLRKALEAALSAVMEAEVSEQLGAAHGERSEGRQGHRNGYRERTFQTGLGNG